MYEQFYGLKNAPFRLSPDPSFFFGSQGHSRALAYLRYGLAQKEGFIVITGAPGTGKTTLARSLLAEVSREKIIIAELNTTHLDADDVLRMVAASFGLEYEGLPKATLLKRLESFCVSRYRAGYHVLLLVDEAQSLPLDSLEELRMLSNFYLGKDALIQIFLLGQEQFRTSLYTTEMEQLRQRVVASSHLEPLGNDETRKYIEHRLSLSGWTNNPQISDRAFARIYALTKGVPRRINTFCERLMLYGALEELTEFHDSTVKAIAKELMGEVSAKGVKLSDINPGVPEIEAAVLESMSPDAESEPNKVINAVDSDILSTFSDDVAVTVVDENKVASPDEAAEELKSFSVAEPSEVDSVFDDTTVLDDVAESDFSALESQKTDLSKSKAESKAEKKAGQIDTAQADKTDGTVDHSDIPKQEKKQSKEKRQDKARQEHSQLLRVVSSGNTAKETFDPVPQTEKPVIDTKPEWWELVALAAAFHNEPEKFKSLTRSKTPIPSGVSDCFKIAIGKMRVPEYLRTGELNAMTDQEIREALRYYIKNVLLSNTADYYRRLGVTSSASFDLIRSHYKFLFRLFQPDKEQNASNWDETYTRRINQAYGTLRSTENRKEYDTFLSALASRNNTPKTKDENNEAEEISVSTASSTTAETMQSATMQSATMQSATAHKTVQATTDTKADQGEKQVSPVKVPLIVGIVVAFAVTALFVMKPDLMQQIQQSLPLSQTSTPSVVSPELKIQDNIDPVVFVKQAVKEIDEVQIDERERVPMEEIQVVSIAPLAVSPDVSKPVIEGAMSKEPVIEKTFLLNKTEKVKQNADVVAMATADVKIAKPIITKPEIAVSAIAKPVIAKPVIAKPKNSVAVEQKQNEKISKPVGEIKKPAVKKTDKLVAKKQVVKTTKASVVVAAPVVVGVAASALVKPVHREIITPASTSSVLKSKSKNTQVIKISPKRLSNFIARFSLAYEEGELESFMVFFSDTASTNEASNKIAIRTNYEKLFSKTEMRVIDLDELKWEIKKQKAVGKGQFVVTVLGDGAEEMKKFTGLIKLEVIEINKKLKLNGMYHAYGADK